MIKEAMLFKQLEDNKVRCFACAHRCIIADGKLGFCRTRENRGGILYTLIYSTVSSEAVDPIEKKPLYHFLPGSLSYSLGSVGCNFRCKHCQNWTISQIAIDSAYTKEISPEEAVGNAVETGCRSISWTYNEPSIWIEYTYDTAKLAKEAGLKTVYVTNGYATPEELELIGPYLDAYRVDIKSFSDEFYRTECSARLSPVLESAKYASELSMHIEVVDLIIPTLNDSREEITKIVRWIKENLGIATPVHFTRFHPMYKMTHLPPTPVATLEMAYQIARNEGMRFPYVGNVAGHKYENTYCPACNALLIDRSGFSIRSYRITGDNRCGKCGELIEIVQ